MSWLPDPPIVLGLFQRINAEENLLQDSSELFWYFYLNSMNPEEFKERTEFWINKQLEDSPKGGGFIDPETRDNILQGPEKLTQIIIDKLDKLSEEKFVPYHPDEKDDAIALYIFTHIEASRLAQFLKSEQYSERTRETLSNTIKSFSRCRNAFSYPNAPWPKEYSVSLEAVGSFLYITQFWLQKSEGIYEDALKSLFWGFAQNMMVSLAFPENGFPNPKAITLLYSINKIGDIWEYAPWMKDLDPQAPVDCFEALHDRNNFKELEDIAHMCAFFVTVAKSWWPNEEDEIEVKDVKGRLWSLPEYWQHALGWTEAQLTPSQLKTIIGEREEQAAEKRLQRYFFETNLWDKLPDRSKSSLISADRDWFSGSSARVESILNELKIAVEELLIQHFWNPIVSWLEKHGQNQRGSQELLALKNELSIAGKNPSILDFERICRMQITGTYLVEKGVIREDRIWFIQNLQRSLFPLRQARNRAEHESGNRLSRDELNRFYSDFLGIGQPGVIKQLSKLLTFINDKNND